MDDQIEHMFIVLVLPSKSQRNALHNIHSLAWAHILMGPQATAQRAHVLRRHWFQDIIPLVHRAYGSVFITNVKHQTVIAVH
jgi:hypothetical protein